MLSKAHCTLSNICLSGVFKKIVSKKRCFGLKRGRLAWECFPRLVSEYIAITFLKIYLKIFFSLLWPFVHTKLTFIEPPKTNNSLKMVSRVF